jgi:hypothetical protein
MDPQEQKIEPRQLDDLSPEEKIELDRRRQAYKDAVEVWIKAIREEEDFARMDHSMAAVEAWEHAHFTEEDTRHTAKQLRQDYQDELRRILFHF